ncbi:OmpA family protein [Adhaeribacter swui]|uniref:OmpA family protein n=1 Tax=Adhaeribacter swui TaxID=2086471 RepID=A0A7G7G5D3_9BACT|nr:OmpA family protein [Adhaeribacter swui]QNF32367.1 OmpA family protein [Adhaeribacter swui]
MKQIFKRAGAVALGLCGLIATTTNAQTADKKWAIGAHANVVQYRGDIGSEFYDWKEGRTGYGLTLSRYLNRALDFSVQANRSRIDYNNNVLGGGPYVAGGPLNYYFDGNMTTVVGAFKLKIGSLFKEGARFDPYLMAGYGGAFAKTNGRGAYGTWPSSTGSYINDGSYANDLVMGAVGLNIRFSETVALTLQTGQLYLFTDQLDGFRGQNADLHDRFLQHTAGLTFSLGKAKDADGDGVPDRKDKCPDTPTGVKVDENGCPVDTDKDGVPDYQDNCPDVAGVAALNGCPDRDNDGVADAQDQCPDQPGSPALNGCPDADGDGVADAQDQCPNTPAGTQVDAKGCPLDTDGDGVNDADDRCPTVAGTPENGGCPRKVLPRGKNRGSVKDTTYIRFETNKAVLKRVSFKTLDDIVRFMKINPEFTIKIEGHADARGTDEYNMALSQRRADAVSRYLTAKGRIAKARVTTEALGESRPMATNDTPEGMAQNRRAEIQLVVTDDLMIDDPATTPSGTGTTPGGTTTPGTTPNGQ